MANKNQSPRRKRFRWWFSRKKKKADPFDLGGLPDAAEEDDNFVGWSIEMDPCISTHELRVLVGTWNVAGRSPVGSLAVDLDEWLNLKDTGQTADIYVLGFQEIVPLTPQTIIAGENATEATNWNMLIGKTLNDKFGCPWLTPMINPINSDDYQYSEIPETEKGNLLRSQSSTQMRKPRSQTGQLYRYSRYKLVASKKMVGLFVSVWIRRELLKMYSISDIKVCSVACGIMGYLGNKGSVSISMSIGGTNFCFIAAHLASGEKKGDEGKRNYQVSEIFRRTCFPRLPREGNNPGPLTILGHDRIFWFGDLNYRLYLEDNLARELIRKQDWSALHKFDQLQKELEDGGVFQGWKEGSLQFPPTYKYASTNSNRYSGGLPSKAGEKQRTPAWYVTTTVFSNAFSCHKSGHATRTPKYSCTVAICRVYRYKSYCTDHVLNHSKVNKFSHYSICRHFSFMESRKVHFQVEFFSSYLRKNDVEEMIQIQNDRCDRILWYGKGVKQLSYFRSESKFSDHRPVSALFSTQIEVVKCANSRLLVPALVAGGTPTRTGQERADDKTTTTLTSLIEMDTEASPTNRQISRPNR